jgi:PLP dependent protein
MIITSDDIKRNIESVLSKIRAVNSSIKLLAVSKTFDKESVAAAVQAGLTEFGESKIQEAEEKIPAVNELFKNLKWHFIGHLQTNKVSKAITFFDCVQTIDSLRLAEKISQSAAGTKTVEALLEIKVSGEETKFGILPEEAGTVIDGIKKLQGISIKGLMTMAPYSDNPENARPYFKKAKALFDELKRTAAGGNVTMETLSMGMSGDYLVAIEEGSTMVRIGSAIFGKKNY